MRSWLKELINIFILVDGLTAVQSPRRTPVKNLTRHSGTGKLFGPTRLRWIGHEVVCFGILHIRNGMSDVSRTLVNDICNICGCKPVVFKFLFQKKLFFNSLPNFQLKKTNLNLFIIHFNRLKGQLCTFYGFLMRNLSWRKTTPLVAVTRVKVVSGSDWRLIKTFSVLKNYHHKTAKKKESCFYSYFAEDKSLHPRW